MTYSNAYLEDENISISIDISLNFVPKDQINHILALVRHQAIVWTNDGKFTDTYMHHTASIS